MHIQTANCNAEIQITDINGCRRREEMTVKELFDAAQGGTLTYEQFMQAAGNAKFVDLTEGNYVSRKKYDDDITSRDSQISTLNDTISTRDKDLAGLKSQLEAAGTDAEKLSQLTGEFDTLKGKYDADTKAYKAQLKQQAYEFAVREFANSKKFTSNAAKRDFIQSMVAKELKMENNTILGAEDFVTAYSANNADAFVVENPNPTPEPPKPQFVNPTPGGDPAPGEQNAFLNAFHFTGVRPVEQ